MASILLHLSGPLVGAVVAAAPSPDPFQAQSRAQSQLPPSLEGQPKSPPAMGLSRSSRPSSSLWRPWFPVALAALLLALPAEILTHRQAFAVLVPSGSPGQSPLPVEIQALADQALEAESRGDWAQALALQQQVMVWVEANLPRRHPFRARSLLQLARFLSAVERQQEALTPARDAVSLYRELANNDPELQLEFAEALSLYGATLSQLQRLQEGLAPMEEALRILRKVGGRDSAARRGLAMVRGNQSRVYGMLQRWPEALPAAEEAVQLQRELIKGDAGAREDLLYSLQFLILVYSSMERWQDALLNSEELVALRRQDVASHRDAHLLPQALMMQAVILDQLKRPQQAQQLAEEAERIYRELIKANPTLLSEMINVLQFLDKIYSQRSLHREELRASRQLVEIFQAIKAADSSASLPLARAWNNLAITYVNLGDWRQSLQALQQGIEILRGLAGNPDAQVELADALLNLGYLHLQLEQPQQALLANEESQRLFRSRADGDATARLGLAKALSNYANNLSLLGQAQKALPFAVESVSLWRGLPISDPVNQGLYAISLTNLASISGELGHQAEALSASVEVVALYRQLARENQQFRINLGRALLDLGYLYSRGKRWQEALTATQEGVGLLRAEPPQGPNSPLLIAQALANIATFHANLGQRQQALPPLQEALAILQELVQSNPALLPILEEIRHNLEMLQALPSPQALGWRDQAHPAGRQAGSSGMVLFG